MDLNGDRYGTGRQPGPGQASPQAQTFKMIAGAVMAAPMLLAIVLWFVAEPDAEISWLVIGAVLVIGAGVGAALPFLARQLPAIPAGQYGEAARRQGLQHFQAAFFRSFAVAELPMFAGLVGMFVVAPTSIWHFVVGAAVTVVLMALYVWPGHATVQRAQERLDREGGQSQLAASFGY